MFSSCRKMKPTLTGVSAEAVGALKAQRPATMHRAISIAMNFFI